MCFIISKKEGFPEAKIAEEDIVCYKWLVEGLKAPFQRSFTYKVGRVQPKVKLVVAKCGITKCGEIYKGYHSYSENALKDGVKLSCESYYKFIIPAGSKYYENPNFDLYVSEKIMLTTNQPLSWEEGIALMGLDKKVNQAEFNTFFTELIQKGVQRKDSSDTCYRLCNKNGEWLFDVDLDSKNPRFWYSHSRIYPLFEEKFGVNEYQLSWLMQPTLETHFKLKAVTAKSIAYDRLLCK